MNKKGSELITRREIISQLRELDIGVTNVTLINYAKEGIIDQPIFEGIGKGAHALYPKNTLQIIYAIHQLINIYRLTIKRMKYIIKVANYIEGRSYTSYYDVVNDEDLSLKISGYADLCVFVLEFLRLEIFAQKWLSPDHPGSHSRPGSNIKVLKDKQAIYNVMEGPGADKEPVPFITPAILVAIATNDRVVLDAILRS